MRLAGTPLQQLAVLLIGFGAAALIVAAVVLALQTQRYQAESLVDIGPRLAAQFEPRITTPGQGPTGESVSRIATSPEVLAELDRRLAQLGLPVSESSGTLRGQLKATPERQVTNLLRLTAESENRERAVLVSRLWTEIVVNQANTGLTARPGRRDVFEELLVRSRNSQAEAQARLESSIRASNLDGLRDQVALAQARIRGLQFEVAERRVPAGPGDAVLPISHQEREAARLQGGVGATNLLIDNARALQQQLEGNPSTGARAALSRTFAELQSSAFGQASAAGALTVPEITPQDVTLLVNALEARRVSLLRRLADLNTPPLNLDADRQRLRLLEAELSAAEAERKLLVAERDLRLDTLLAVAKKLEEVAILETEADPLARVALAASSASPVGASPVVTLLGAGLGGLLLGLVAWLILSSGGRAQVRDLIVERGNGNDGR